MFLIYKTIKTKRYVFERQIYTSKIEAVFEVFENTDLCFRLFKEKTKYYLFVWGFILLDLASKSKLIFHLHVRCRNSFVLGFVSKVLFGCPLTFK